MTRRVIIISGEHDRGVGGMTGASPVTTIDETGIGSRRAVFSMN